MITSTNPTGGSAAWNVASIDSRNAGCSSGDCYGLAGVSCPSVSLCVAVDAVGNVIASTNPTGGASTWHAAKVDSKGTVCSPDSGCVGLNRASCPSASLCVAADLAGNVLTSNDLTRGATAWTLRRIPQAAYSAVLGGLSCSSALLCVALGNYGSSLVASTDPTGGAGAWTSTNFLGRGGSGFGSLAALSCIRRTSLCVVFDESGNILVSDDPVGGRAAWTVTPVATGVGFLSSVAVACTRGMLCVGAALGYVAVARGQPPLAPLKRSRPRIIGNAVIGHVLRERHGTWGHVPAMLVYRWEDCDRRGWRCRLIPGADGQRYKVRRSDVGHKVRVQETALNAGGTGPWTTSRPVQGLLKRGGHRRLTAVLVADVGDTGGEAGGAAQRDHR